MMSNKAIPIFTLFLFLTMIGCNDEKQPELEPDVELDIKQSDSANTQTNYNTQSIIYQVPTPNELFSLFKEVEMSFDFGVLNSVDNVEKYSNKKLKALNFGIYSADLAFASSFGVSTESINYFKTIKDLGDDLKINSAFDDAVFERIEINIESDNQDSLFYISNETYSNAYTYLEDNDRGATLALIVLGGWIEGLYIMTNLGEFDEGSDLINRIADQKLTFENLMGFMDKYNYDSDVVEMIEELNEIQNIFMALDQSEIEITTSKENNGIFILDGGANLILDEEQFNALKTLVDSYRSSIVDAAI